MNAKLISAHSVPANCRPARFGITLMEVTAAAALLAMLLASSVHAFRALSSHQRAADRYALALQTAQNLMEDFANKPWEDLKTGINNNLTAPSAIAQYLPGAQITATVVDEKEPIVSKRISITLTWDTQSGPPASPVRLTAWAFPEPSVQ